MLGKLFLLTLNPNINDDIKYNIDYFNKLISAITKIEKFILKDDDKPKSKNVRQTWVQRLKNKNIYDKLLEVNKIIIGKGKSLDAILKTVVDYRDNKLKNCKIIIESIDELVNEYEGLF